jgi:hypothetical protein
MGRLDPSASIAYRVPQSTAGHITQNEPKMREIGIKVTCLRSDEQQNGRQVSGVRKMRGALKDENVSFLFLLKI